MLIVNAASAKRSLATSLPGRLEPTDIHARTAGFRQIAELRD
jgi:hypothetical protein